MIFNFQELNARLERKIYEFKSNTEELKYLKGRLDGEDYVRQANALLN